MLGRGVNPCLLPGLCVRELCEIVVVYGPHFVLGRKKDGRKEDGGN